jgi:hypothetical protein
MSRILDELCDFVQSLTCNWPASELDAVVWNYRIDDAELRAVSPTRADAQARAALRHWERLEYGSADDEDDDDIEPVVTLR